MRSGLGETTWVRASALLRVVLFICLNLAVVASVEAAEHSQAPMCRGTSGRFALLIGNQDYAGALTSLNNPRHDTAAFAKLLCANDFTVYRHSDLDIAQFDSVLSTFADVVKGAKTALVYYSGHGFAAGGRNWLVPVDANLDCDSLDGAKRADTTSLQRRLVDVSSGVLNALEAATDQIVILDACRTNPIRSCFRGDSTPTLVKGLTRLPSSGGRLIVYASQDGQPALDGVDGSDTSPLMTAITKRLPGQAGINWREAMFDAGDEVERLTNERQIPNYDSSRRLQGCLSGHCEATTSSARPPADVGAADAGLLAVISGLKDRAALELLKANPNASLREAVAKRLAALPPESSGSSAKAGAQGVTSLDAPDQAPRVPAPSPSAPRFADRIMLTIKQGTIVIQLRPDLAPKHVKQIEVLTNEGFYNGLSFHRVIGGFMAQTGDPTGTGSGGSKLPDLAAEFSNEPFKRGTVGMARTSDPNSANSQFFICFGDASFLNKQYTVVGQVVSGMDVVDKIKKGSTSANGMVTNPDRIVAMRASR